MIDMRYYFPFFFALPALSASLASTGSRTVSLKRRGISNMQNNLFDLSNVVYGINVTLAGTGITLEIDTGSTDMFILNPTSLLGPFNETTAVASIGYEDGTGVNGTVGLATLEIAGYTIHAQAFINGTSGGPFFFAGLVGLGFDAPTDPIPSGLTAAGLNGSEIGKSVLSNIFDQNPELPRFFALSLARNGDEGGTADGGLTIGEYDDRYSEVQHAPLLPLFGTGAWKVLMDGIFVNGVEIPWARDPKGTVPEGKVAGVLDSGTSHLVVPSDIVDGLYSAVPGAVQVFDDDGKSSKWVVPCTAAINLHLTFGGQNFTVHPLDLSDLHNFTTSDNRTFTACLNAVGADFDLGRDAVFGQSFLRNVYTVFGFGNATAAPYTQLLSLVNESTAVADFMSVRAPLLASGPPELPPAELVRIFVEDDQRMTSAMSSSSVSSATPQPSRLSPSTLSSDSAAPTVTNIIANDTSTGSNLAHLDLAAADAPSAAPDSIISKYAPIVIGLLGANLALLLFLLVLAISSIVRTGRDAGARGGRDARYTRVQLNES
ncbi:aspartic peptidase domain-containing protein [Mycena belliarum]|uniref:Aspartic peptidase domain-containing protein n=1 Tax=Mycena belliarum TaxID=1033014 RepID=A0AAD6U8L4_9AGAR|nr:aspartic peptidase domain-containing protein [Mycena belliae]